MEHQPPVVGKEFAELRATHAELDTLRAQLVRAQQMRRVLTDVILAVGSNLPMPEVLLRVCGIVDVAYESFGGVVYLWEPEVDRLVLRVISDPHSRGQEISRIQDGDELHGVQMRLGEGLVGWTALHKQPVLVPDEPWKDPRAKLFQQIPEEGVYGSGVLLPILLPDGELLGVVGLYARRRNHFTDEHVRLLSEITALLATVIEKARLDEESARRAEVLGFLGEMGARLASRGATRELMDWVAARTAEVMASPACLIVTSGPGRRFAVTGVAGASADTPGLGGEELFRDLADLLPEQFAEAASAPLLAGAEQLGFISCYRDRRYSIADRDLLAIVAAQVALGYHVLGGDRREHDPAAQLLALLASGRRSAATAAIAASVGVELTKPHVLVQARFVPTEGPLTEAVGDRFARAIKHFVRAVEAHRPGSLLREVSGGVEGLARIARPADSAALQRTIIEVTTDLTDRLGILISVGLSSACTAVDQYLDAHREAAEALEIGSRLRGEGHVVRFEELGPDLYLFRMAADPRYRRDPWVRTVAALVTDKERRGADLLGTLDAYLESRGRTAVCAARLGLHRNTLRQRLDRIEVLTGINLDDETQDWLPLRLAVKLTRMKESEQR